MKKTTRKTKQKKKLTGNKSHVMMVKSNYHTVTPRSNSIMKKLQTKFRVNKKNIQILAGLLMLGIASIPSLYFYNKYKAAQRLLQDSTQILQEEARLLQENVGKLILLPEGEEPTIMTVTDKEKLSGQEFFAHAKNGDKVLVYATAKKAFLYDPNANMVLEVGPLLDTTPTPGPDSSAEEDKLRVVIYNGTQETGVTTRIGRDLETKLPIISIVNNDFAEKRDYAQSTVIGLTDVGKQNVQNIALELNAGISSLPDGEISPSNADILVIIGEDSL